MGIKVGHVQIYHNHACDLYDVSALILLVERIKMVTILKLFYSFTRETVLLNYIQLRFCQLCCYFTIKMAF